MSSNKRGKVLAVVGAQFGSEGKGVIVNKIAHRYKVHVRTGGPNAGHTFMYKDQKIVMQTIPCGWTNPEAICVIGAGALIDLALLKKEYDTVTAFFPDFHQRLIIDGDAHIITDQHQIEEGGVDGEMHKRIGSTGKGVGASRRDRMMRDPSKCMAIGEFDVRSIGIDRNVIQFQTSNWLNRQIQSGWDTLLEGTQGVGLDLIHGIWPFVTSNGCSTAQMLADCGIAPSRLTDTLLVARTYPIRVAGNSGPLRGEMTWDKISAQMGRPVEEKTTVTKKVRRIGEWDDDLMDRAVSLTGAEYCAITFMDYLSPQDEGSTQWSELSQQSQVFARFIEARFGVKVALIGTGGEGFNVIERIII